MRNITEFKSWRIWLTNLMALFFALNLSAQPVIVEIGTGTSTMGHPFYSLYHDSRTQIIYTAAEITAAGGSAGLISSIGFNVSSANTYTLNGMNIDLQATSATSLTGFVDQAGPTVSVELILFRLPVGKPLRLTLPLIGMVLQMCLSIFVLTTRAGAAIVMFTAAPLQE